MKRAVDFRNEAREALRGKWGMATITAFIAYLFGAGIVSSESSFSIDTESLSEAFKEMDMKQVWSIIEPIVSIFAIALIIFAIVCIVISGSIKLGYALFNIKLINKEDAKVSDLFSQKHRIGAGFVMNFLTSLYTCLWALLFIIPGIVKIFSYAMTPYILSEDPSMTANEAITESKEIMDGNKWRLFCLWFSFIGWDILCGLPSGFLAGIIMVSAAFSGNVAALIWIFPAMIPSAIAMYFVAAYKEAATAAFYNDIKLKKTPFRQLMAEAAREEKNEKEEDSFRMSW